MKPNIAIISFPWASKAPYKFLSDVLKILEPLSDSLILLNGNTHRIEVCGNMVDIRDVGVSMHYAKDIRPKFYSMMLWVAKCILFQIKASFELLKLAKDIDVIIFYVAYPYHLMPLLVAKICGIKTIEVITRSKLGTPSTYKKIFTIQDRIFFSLIDGISPESESLIAQLNLNAYHNKILPIGARFVDVDYFKIETKIDERKKLVGYIGRIRQEKGVMNFVKAVPLILEMHIDVEFLVGGDGDLLDKIKSINEHEKYEIALPGWISQERFPKCLNELKLFVLPTSHAEGLPTIILESMACGTPVLATAVGGIPDVVKDGETGFIMENNSPECIAENVIRALNNPNLKMIVENAKKQIEKNYCYEAAVERYKKIIN